MKITSDSPTIALARRISAMVACLFPLVSSVHATGGSWTATAGGNWSLASNWGGTVPVPIAGEVINFNSALAAASTVTLDGTSRTIGDLNIGATTAFGFTIASSAGTVVINLDGLGTADGTIDFTGTVANAISAPITLVDNGVIRSNIAAVQTLSGIISGTGKSLTFNNDTNGVVTAATSLGGQFLVTGNNTYTGGTNISDVRVQIQTNNTALGAAGSAVTIADGGQFYNSSGLQTINYAFSIAGNGWQETAGKLGALRLEGGAIVTGTVAMTANAAIGSNSGTGTVNGVISGTGFTLSKVGTGAIVLGGANTYSGGTTITNGSVQLNNNAAAGTGTISLVTGGATNGTRLLVNGGVTAANNVSIVGNIFGVVGQGALQQVGTGLGTINGTINITGTPTAGGHFLGGAVATNALVLGGAITSTVPLTQRDGFVRYGGGGTGYASLGITGTAQVGATNGIATTAAVALGVSSSATLDLNGFDQTLASLTVGNSTLANAFTGNISLGAKTLTLNGDITSVSNTGHAAPHVFTGSGATLTTVGARNIVLPDSLSLDDLSIISTTMTGGGLTKSGAGALALQNVTLTQPLTISAGTLRTGLSNQVGSIIGTSLTFSGGTTLAMKVGPGGDIINTGTLVNSGTTNLVLNQFGGMLAPGTYPLINYTGATPGTAGFALAPIGHATASLLDTGSAIALVISANDKVTWDGTASTAWATGVTGNWKLPGGASTDFVTGDDVTFNDLPTNNTVAIAANVTPSAMTFNNTTTTAYTVSGAGGIIGTTGLNKTGNGVLNLGTPNQYGGITNVAAGTLNLTGSLNGSSVTVASGATFTATGAIAGTGTSVTSSGTTTLQPGAANTYTGATTVNAGTFTANYTTAVALPAVSPVSVATGATLKLTHAGGVFSLVNPLSGAGTVVIDPGTTTAAARDLSTVTWNATGFTGLLNLKPTVGTMRLTIDNPTDLGGSTVQVDSGGQLFFNTATQTYPNNISITGTGYSETAGFLGAIRAANPTTFTGAITVPTTAKLGALAGSAIIANSLTGGTLTFGGSLAAASSENMLITGTVGLTSLIVNDGLATGGATSIAVNVGNNTASGTIGATPVSLLADGFKNSVIRFDRTDGYTLGAGVTSIGTAANFVRTFIDADSQGTGFSDGGFAINLGGSTTATGGQYRVGVNRANSIGNISGALTAGTVQVGTGAFANATLNFNTGANANFGTLNLVTNAIGTGSTVNFNGGTVNADYVNMGNIANGSANINQAAGSTVNIASQLRIGHFATETSTYNMNGGTLTLTGASPTLTPSTLNAGAASSTGDNNINASATFPTITGGGIYVGVDGQGVFNHTGGTVTTNWIVLDNRTDTLAGTNMVDGIDKYNLSGAGSILNLRSTWGIIQRNTSAVMNLGGGTIRVDNTGTGGLAGNTGANLNIPLDVNLVAAPSTTTSLDTNGATNAFTLNRDITGTGTLNLIGGGNINLSTTGVQQITTVLSGTTPLVKQGSGQTLITGNAAGYTGNITVSAGLLQVPTTLGAGNITVQDAATISGEALLVNTLTFGVSTGGIIVFNPNTPGALTTNALVINGTNLIDLTEAPTAAGPYTVLYYTSKTGAGTFAAANPANYRTAPSIVDTGSAITLDITGRKTLTWTGLNSAVWNIGTPGTINWVDTVSAPEKFYTTDDVIFPEGAANTSITLAGVVVPSSILVNATTTPYTFTSTAGNQLSGATGITKTGGGTLTLVGPNIYNGVTSIGGGTVVISAVNSLGSGLAGNSIAISGGGRLSEVGVTAVDLGATRNIAVGTGGGSISHNSTTAVNFTIPGNITGSGTDTLSFHSATTGAGTFILTGDNSGYTGRISIDAPASGTGGLTTVRLGTTSSVPASGSITINYPVGGANGNATTLDLPAPGRTLPAGLTLNLTSLQSTSVLSLRSQVTGGTGNSVFNGPITLAGSSISQFTINTPGSFTYNNTIGETTLGSFVENLSAFAYSNILFLRGTGTHTVNNTVTLPSAGSVFANTDGATVIVNSTGNTWKSTNALFGTMRIGATDALATTARLVVGQTGDQVTTVDLNGFNQTVGGLEWQAPTGNLLTKGISNSHPTATSTFTVNQATAPTINANFNGTISGRINLVKEGAATVSLVAPASTFTGNVTVNAGTLSATGLGGATAGTLGNPSVAGRIVTINNTGTLSLLTNNIFGNGVGNANLPAVVVNAGGTVSSTRYNVLGDVTLNGGLLTQAATDGPGVYEGYQFRGSITSGGTAASTISTTNARANHLGANTIITVADATSDPLADLIISAPLKNQSGDFANAVAAFTKMGPGTLQLGGANTYTGVTTVSAGTVALAGAGSIADTSSVNLTSATAVIDISAISASSETVANLEGVSGSSVVLGGKNLSFGGDNLPSNFAGVGSGTGGSLTKTGTNTTTISGPNTYDGGTFINGGTLLLGADNALPDTAALTLSGGSLATGGFSDSTGALSVNAASVVDMGASAGSVLTFANVGTWTGMLSIWNYTGPVWGLGTDKLIFTAGSGSIPLANLQFYSDNGLTQIGTGGGGLIGNELVPVPEPSAIAALLGLLGLAGWKERRRFLHYRN